MDKNKLFSWIILAFFVFAALIMVFFISSHVQDTTKENATYNRFVACGLSVPATERTQEKIDTCWDMVVKDTGYSVKRYDVK